MPIASVQNGHAVSFQVFAFTSRQCQSFLLYACAHENPSVSSITGMCVRACVRAYVCVRMCVCVCVCACLCVCVYAHACVSLFTCILYMFIYSRAHTGNGNQLFNMTADGRIEPYKNSGLCLDLGSGDATLFVFAG